VEIIVVSVGDDNSRESFSGTATEFVTLAPGPTDPRDEIPVDDIGFLLPNGFIFLRAVHFTDDSQEEFFSETKDGRDSGVMHYPSRSVPSAREPH
jgi:hypothetical protein